MPDHVAAAATEMPPCDLVMKGGITSGVVYPRLISELAAKYRFKNIGGTSAGAIAAAGCAAAEYRRQNGGDMGGFGELSRLPGQLGDPVGGRKGSMLFHLFQPAAPVAKHFAVLVSMLNAPHPLTALGRALWAMVQQFWAMALLGMVLALLLFAPMVSMAAPTASHTLAFGGALVLLAAWWLWAAFGLRRLDRLQASPVLAPAIWWIAALVVTVLVLRLLVRAESGWHLGVATLATGLAAPLTIGLVLALSGLRFGITLVKGMHGNGYGICSGRTMHDDPNGPQGLTDWLSRYFNGLAGLGAARPLAFGDLWGLKVEGEFFAQREPATRAIDLQVMTTAVSQQLCFSLPFRAGPDLYFDADEWGRLFPEWVMQWIKRASQARTEQAAAAGARTDRVVFEAAGKPPRVLSLLPANANLPVVVAVRMSLSFPGLLSAVPLYAVDYSRAHNQRPGAEAAAASPAPFVLRATRVWFSDGGIASNLPLHFFDAPLPGHPTFAVNLKDEHPDYPIDPARKAHEQKGRVYLPQGNAGGLQRYWPAPMDERPIGGLVGFLLSIVHTMQNWRDEVQFPYPGYRDRIVQVSQLEDEGGLNLNMAKQHIHNLSDAGAYAAQRLVERFHYRPDQPVSAGWKNHREVRLRTFLGVLEEMALTLQPKLAGDAWGRVVDGISSDVYARGHDELARQCLQRLEDLADVLQDNRDYSLLERAPKPRASMRIAPLI